MSVFRINQPKNTVHLSWSHNLANRICSALDRRQAYVDSECIRLMNPLTPRRTGALVDSATLHTVIGTGVIKQQTPYARKQYYETHLHHDVGGARWFEVMKNRHKDQILKGASRL